MQDHDMIERLAMVLAEPQLRQLRELGGGREGGLADLLFNLFSLVVEQFALSQDPAASMLLASLGMQALLRQAGRRAGAARAIGGAAMFYFRRWTGEEQVARQFGPPQQDGRDVSAGFNLVAELTESERHLLVEIFYRPALLDAGTAGRLLFSYRQELEKMLRLPLA